MDSLPQRKISRHPTFDYSTPGAYFVTVCVHRRRSLLGAIQENEMRLNDAGLMIVKWWMKLNDRFPVMQDEFIVMPNHFHGIIIVTDPPPGNPPAQPEKRPVRSNKETLFQVMDWFKTMTTNEYIRGVKLLGWPRFDQHFWQPRYFDHVIRSERKRDVLRRYIISNPARWSMDIENPQRTRLR
jgi:REP element-mobilizing transposase RayT